MTNAEMPSPDSIEQEPHSGQLERPSDDNRGLHPGPNNPADYGGHWEIPVNPDIEDSPDPLERLRMIRKEQGLDTPGASDKYNSEGRSPRGVTRQHGSDNSFFNSLES